MFFVRCRCIGDPLIRHIPFKNNVSDLRSDQFLKSDSVTKPARISFRPVLQDFPRINGNYVGLRPEQDIVIVETLSNQEISGNARTRLARECTNSLPGLCLLWDGDEQWIILLNCLCHEVYGVHVVFLHALIPLEPGFFFESQESFDFAKIFHDDLFIFLKKLIVNVSALRFLLLNSDVSKTPTVLRSDISMTGHQT